MQEYQATLKSQDTEEHIDLYFYRRIGYAWARLARRLGITPNAITVASIILGAAAGWMFFYQNLWLNILGIVLLVWANSFDSADGQLARMTGQYSRLGRILDGMAGDVWFVSIYFFICLREDFTPGFFSEYPLVIWILAAVTGFFHGKQAAMADYYRQFHLYFIKGEAASELETSAAVKERRAKLSWKHNAWEKLILWFYINYIKQQEQMTPGMQQLRRALRQRFPDGRISERFRNDFRAESLPLMKYANILTFNWRSFVLFACVLCGQPWLYFVFELTVMNFLLLYLNNRHERICRRLTRKLIDGKY